MTRRALPVLRRENPPPSTPGAALYVPPAPRAMSVRDPGRTCSSCVLWVAGENACTIHERALRIEAGQVCGYHLHGVPLFEWLTFPQLQRVTPETSGLIWTPPGGTRCGNCRWFERSSAPPSMVGVCGRVASSIELDGAWRPAEVAELGCCAQWES